MTAHLRLDLMPRDTFAKLSLHAKNDYLRDLALRFCRATNRPATDLDKDALSRLRRFYLRRRLADLRAHELPDNDLGRALRGLGDAIKNSDHADDVTAALKAELPAPEPAAPILREPPADDAQLAFFVPALFDAPIKDDVNIMDVAPFSLSKDHRTGIIHYELKDAIITVEGGVKTGIATVFDYDIFLNMVSALAEEMRRFQIADAKGRRREAPARFYRPNAVHILKFTRRSDGGRQYKALEAALDRLSATRIKIVNLAGGKRREALNIPLIDGYKVLSKTSTGHIDQVEIGIPNWIYDSIVRQKGPPHILTLNPDYFLISQAIGRFIYRLARKAAGKGEARYSFSELHKRSGSNQDLRRFSHDLRALVAKTHTFPLPDYDLSITPGQSEAVLVMTYRPDPDTKDDRQPALPLP